MANAEYGRAASQEELRRSGYSLPDHFFVSGEEEASEPTKADESVPAVENKAVLPTRKKAATAKRK